MKYLCVMITLVASLYGQAVTGYQGLTKGLSNRIEGTYTTSINIALDFIGKDDTRVSTWGKTDSYGSPIKFNAPAGYRVRILHVYGDFIAQPLGVVAPGTYCEIGWGLKSTAPDGSTRVTYPGYRNTAFDNSFVWRQDFVNSANQGKSLHFDYATNFLLESDNILISQAFIALNTTGLTIHMEPTFTVEYQFESN
jgi:hypothetical protein